MGFILFKYPSLFSVKKEQGIWKHNQITPWKKVLIMCQVPSYLFRKSKRQFSQISASILLKPFKIQP